MGLDCVGEIVTNHKASGEFNTKLRSKIRRGACIAGSKLDVLSYFLLEPTKKGKKSKALC